MKEAGVMLIIKDGLILGITRRNDRTKYGFPGGKLDSSSGDKCVLDAALRETLEETGLVVKCCVYVHARVELGDGPTGEDFLCTCFYATNWEGEPHDSEEGSVAWLAPEEITISKAAFGSFNRKTLDVFKMMFPDIKLKNE